MVKLKGAREEKKTTIAVLIFWTIYSGIALSGWSYYIICELLRFPFYIYEVFFLVPIIVYYRELYKALVRIRRSYLLMLLFLLGMLLIGCILNSQYIIEQITTYRTILYVWVFACIFSKCKVFNLLILQAMCIGASLGQMIYIMYISNESDQTAVNIVALTLMVIIPVIKNNVKEMIIFTILGLVIAFRSSFRVNILVVMLAVLFSLLYMSFVKKNLKVYSVILGAIVCVVLLVLNFSTVAMFLVDFLHMDNLMSVYRIIYRLEQFLKLDFVASQDSIRFELMAKIFTAFYDYIIPQGLIGKAIGEYGLYKDAPIIFFYSAFGSIGAMLILGMLLIKAITYVWKTLKFKQVELGVFSIILPIYIFLFLLNGTFILATYEACLTGIVIGFWLNKNGLTTIVTVR